MFPKEASYPIQDSKFVKLRLTIGLDLKTQEFWVESDLVQSENDKIFQHLGKKFKIQTEHDAIQDGLNFYYSIKK